MQNLALQPLMSKEAICKALGISKRTIENMCREGSFPPPVRIGKCVYWSERAVQAWQHQLFAAQEAWRG